ncbi:hypothetical protein JTB14_031489 [Gonioctena quinquepunctata]|nr:hypothetical protein JTB14_031489 [Gonioctena quinquepunctata]
MIYNLEIFSNSIIWVFSVLFSIFSFSIRAKDYFRNYRDEYNDFSEGIELLSTRRDKSDLEWESINYLLRHYYPWILLYMIVSEISRYFYKSKEVLQIWHILFTTTYVLLKLGHIPLFLLLTQPVLFRTVKCLGSENIYTWICSGASIAYLTIYKSLNTEQDLWDLNEYESYLFTMALFWMNLKCTSYYLELPKSTNTLDFFSLLFWFAFGHVCLHFVYVNSASLQLELIENLDSWSLYGYGYTMGQFFHLKYVVLYGLSTSIASFENIEVPHLPRCIGRIHLYSDMWKCFDPGLHKFLLRHIYIPLIRVTNKPIASLLCFGFIFVWHGLEIHILIWAALNYIGIMIECLLWPVSKRNETKTNEPWTRIRDCLLASPLLAMSAISNFYFFAGKEVGDIFLRRISTDKPRNTIVLLMILYCCCQVSTQFRSVSARKM